MNKGADEPRQRTTEMTNEKSCIEAAGELPEYGSVVFFWTWLGAGFVLKKPKFELFALEQYTWDFISD